MNYITNISFSCPEFLDIHSDKKPPRQNLEISLKSDLLLNEEDLALMNEDLDQTGDVRMVLSDFYKRVNLPA